MGRLPSLVYGVTTMKKFAIAFVALSLVTAPVLAQETRTAASLGAIPVEQAENEPWCDRAAETYADAHGAMQGGFVDGEREQLVRGEKQQCLLVGPAAYLRFLIEEDVVAA